MDTKLFSNEPGATRDGIVYNKDGSNNHLPVAANPGLQPDDAPVTVTPPVFDPGPRRADNAGGSARPDYALQHGQ